MLHAKRKFSSRGHNYPGGHCIRVLMIIFIVVQLLLPMAAWATGQQGHSRHEIQDSVTAEFPRPLASYEDPVDSSVLQRLNHRISVEPFNLVATLFFLVAIFHTFIAGRLTALAQKWEKAYDKKKAVGQVPQNSFPQGARLLQMLGEVETVFGVWAVVLLGVVAMRFDFNTVEAYVTENVNFTEAMFVVVIMTLASTRPILKLSERIMTVIASTLGGSLTVWWMTILILGPILGSFITEPAAMTISALLLFHKFYSLNPSNRFKHATLGLLFVNVSIGGTLTHFASPPVLMVATPWDWDMGFMLSHFGWKAGLAIFLSTTAYALYFRKELKTLSQTFNTQKLKDAIRSQFVDYAKVETEFERMRYESDLAVGFDKAIQEQVQKASHAAGNKLRKKFMARVEDTGTPKDMAEEAFNQVYAEVIKSRLQREIPHVLPLEDRVPWVDPEWDNREGPVPAWITLVHLFFIVWTVVNAHHPQLFIPGLLFFLAFADITETYQNRVKLKAPLLVGFFLAGLVIHGGLQGWWIEPVLGSLSEIPLMLTATGLTAFNDNSAITYLGTLVPGLTEGAKYAMVAGAVIGGGLTVIANAPNPAGQSILKGRFENGISPLSLLAGASVPTLIALVVFLFFK